MNEVITERGPTPEHHHYHGESCGMRGRTCTREGCWWAIDAGILPLHEDCEAFTLECAVALPHHAGDAEWTTAIVQQTGAHVLVPVCRAHRES